MSLPRPVRPEYTITVPSTGKKIKYQPFTVKEEKALVLAGESKDNDEIVNAVRNVLNICITTPEVNIDDLAIFDIEYLFLQTRMKSAGEKITVSVTDPSDETYSVDVEIELDKIQVQKNPDHKDTIQIDKETSVKLKYPNIDSFVDGITIDNFDSATKNIKQCISQIIVGDEVYNKSDMTDAEIQEWVDGLTRSQFKKVVDFFVTMPKMKHEITLTNPNTKKEFTITLEGLSDFF
jgi:hypothetical protein